MSLGEKILKLRKKEGLSQEELGNKINVTRQTISNWELNETSPNTEQLKSLSREFHISIDELLDNDINNVLVEKVSNTESVTKKSFMLLKILAVVIVSIILIFIILVVTKIIIKNTRNYGSKINESIHCKIYGEEHSFNITYYELTGEPVELGGDAYFSDILDLDKYNDAHQIFNIINDYVKKNGGTCTMIYEDHLDNIIDVSIKEGSLSKTGLTLIITENVDYDIEYGEEFYLQKYNYETNTYERLEEDESKNCAFNMKAYSATPDHPLELKQDWSCQYGELDKGLYRLVKGVFFSSDIPISGNDEFDISQEFIIE